MPSAQQHRQQHDSNIQLIGTLAVANPVPYDWIVTLYFYAAIHLVEEHRVNNNLSNSGIHSVRNEYVNNNFTERFVVCYNSLKKESRNARYKCMAMNQGKVSNAKRNYEFIRNTFIPQVQQLPPASAQVLPVTNSSTNSTPRSVPTPNNVLEKTE